MNKTAQPMSMSPAVQNAQMAMGQEQSVSKDDMFKNLFVDRAYKSFTGKYPFLVDYIANFKVINTNVDEGYAVGAFFLNFGQEQKIFMVPIILKSNNIEPIMFIYDQAMDMFLPMSQEWIDEILKKIQQSAGEVVKPNMKLLNQSDNISALPTTAYMGGLSNVVNKLGSIVDVPEVVSGLSKEAKEKVYDILKENKKVAEYYFNTYDFEKIKESFKTAVEEAPEEKDVEVVTAHTPLDYIKKEFGKDHVVMDDLATRGYHVRDGRETGNNLVVFTEHLNSLENPSKSGMYELFLSTGKMAPGLIIQDPILIDTLCEPVSVSGYHPNEKYKTYHVIAKNQAMVLFPNGDYTITKNDNMMAVPTLAETIEDSPLYKTIFGDKTTPIPIDKPFCFVKKQGHYYLSTGPIRIKSKVDEGDAIRCTTNYGDNTIIYSSKYRGNTIYVTKNNTVFVPDSFKVMLLKDEAPKDVVIGSMKTILTMMNSRLLERGGKPITIVKDDRGEYGVETNRPVTKYKTITKIAKEYDVNAKDVEKVLDTMDKMGSKIMTTYVVPKERSIREMIVKEKEAQMPMDPAMMQAQMGGQMPPQGMMDPAMMQAQMGGQPGMMPPQGMGMMDPAMAQGPMPGQMMDQGAMLAEQMDDQGLFDTSALMSLAYISELEQLFPKYLPNLLTALDNIARIILNFWINGDELEEEIGITEYSHLETKLKTLYDNLADLLLTLNKKIDIFAHKQS